MKELFNSFIKGKTKRELYKTFALQIGTVGLGFLTNIVIARLFGKENFGIYSYFFSLTGILLLFSSFGLPQYLSKVIILKKGGAQLIKKASSIEFILAVVLCSVGLIISQKLGMSPEIKYFSIIVFSYVFLKSIYRLYSAALRGMKRFGLSQLYNLLFRLTFLILVLIAAYYEKIVLIFVFNVVAVIVVLLLSRKEVSRKLDITVKKILKYKTILGASLAFFFQTVAFFSIYHIDRISITYLTTFSQLGEYNAFASFTNSIRLLASVFPLVLIPLAAKNKYKLRKSFYKLVALLIPFSLAILLLSKIVVPFLFGSEFNVGLQLIGALVLSSSLLVVYSFFNSIYLGEGMQNKRQLKILFLDVVLSVGLNLILNIYLIKMLGIIGAPIATSIVLILKVGLNMYGIKKERLLGRKNGA